MNTLSHVVSASPRTARVSFASILQSAILLMLVIGTSYLYGTDRPDTGNGRFLRAPKPIPGEYLVVLDRSIRAADVEPRGRALTKQFGGRLVGVATNAANLLHVELNENSASLKSPSSFREYYPLRSGTSFSAAIVSGLVAQYLEQNPSFTPEEVWNAIDGRSVTLSNAGDYAPHNVGSIPFIQLPACP